MPQTTTKQGRQRGSFDVSVKFADGSALKIVQSANGMKATTKPEDRGLCLRLEIGVKHAMFSRTEFADMQTFGRIETAAQACRGIDAFAGVWEKALDVDVDALLPKPRDDGRTVVALKGGRAQELKIHFSGGERLETTINKSSISILCRPSARTMEEDVTKFLFGVKGTGMLDDETLATRLAAIAESCGGIDEWLEAARRDVFAPAAPRM